MHSMLSVFCSAHLQSVRHSFVIHRRDPLLGTNRYLLIDVHNMLQQQSGTAQGSPYQYSLSVVAWLPATIRLAACQQLLFVH